MLKQRQRYCYAHTCSGTVINLFCLLWGPILQTRVGTSFSSLCCPATHQHWLCCRCCWPCTVLTVSTQSSGWFYPTDGGSCIWSPSSGQTPGGDVPLWCEWGGFGSELMGSNGKSSWIKFQISSTLPCNTFLYWLKHVYPCEVNDTTLMSMASTQLAFWKFSEDWMKSYYIILHVLTCKGANLTKVNLSVKVHLE